MVDAETGKALPLVEVCVLRANSCLTNAEGYFQLDVKNGDIIYISKTGYAQMESAAESMEKEIRMKPLTASDSHLSEEETEKMLNKVGARMLKHGRKNRGRQYYLYRVLIDNSNKCRLSEALVTACPTNNLRRMEFIKRQAYNDVEEETADKMPLYLQRTYINAVMQLGPLIQDAPNWRSLNRPFIINGTSDLGFHVSASIMKRYSLRCELLRNQRGETIYKVDMGPRTEKSHTTSSGAEAIRIPAPAHLIAEYPGELAGTLYLDTNLHPMAFEAEVRDYKILSRDGWLPAECRVSIVYSYKKGRTEVKHVYGMLAYGNTSSYAMMCQVPKNWDENGFNQPLPLLRTREEQTAASAYQGTE